MPTPAGVIGRSVATLVECLRDVEGREEKPDGQEAQSPVGRLPDRNLAQVACRWREDTERLRHALPEVGDMAGDPEPDDTERDENAGDGELEQQRPSEEPGEVETS